MFLSVLSVQIEKIEAYRAHRPVIIAGRVGQRQHVFSPRL